MPYQVRGRRQGRKSKASPRLSLQKPSGVISTRVQKVGGERFAIVCVDPAKHRSEWMMADYFGNLLIQPQTLTHGASGFRSATDLVHQAQEQHDIGDTIVVVERTGNYYLPLKQAFTSAGFETRIVHPFATKQYRMPADPGNKTDETDLYAQHRAAVAGFGLCEYELEPPYRELQLRARHRRNLIEKSSAIACQIRDHLHLAMPGFGTLFDNLLDHKSAMAIACRCESATEVISLGRAKLSQHLKDLHIRHQLRTLDKVLAWSRGAVDDPVVDGPMHHEILSNLYDLYQHFRQKTAVLQQELATDLVQTPYVRLLAIPGINVVSAADFAGEMGPIWRYANANAITGRAGLYPSRHQSDQTDHDSGPIIRQANRRLRAALMRIADNLVGHCAYYRGQADVDQARGVDKRASRVKIAKRFSRLALACVAGDEPMKHSCFQRPDSIIEKLREFHHRHQTPVDQVLADLESAAGQLPYNMRGYEARVVADVLQKQANRRRGGVAIGDLLPAVLARLEIKTTENENRDRP